jgi:hypothetical protein
MPTTTNFGWTTPADTDLVKDGAAAIRTLAGNIDTSLVDLKGGTSGQYLTKNSNTDLDYAWVDLSAGGMTLLSTTTLSGGTTTISSISGSYNNLFVTVTGVTLSTDAIITCRINGSSTGHYQNRTVSLGSAWTEYQNSPIYLTGGSSITAATGKVSYAIQFFNYASATHIPFLINGSFSNTADGFRSTFIGGAYETTSAMTSLSFVTGAGTFSAGTVKIYGVK